MENIYLTSSQTITTTDITPVTRPNMCNNWNEKNFLTIFHNSLSNLIARLEETPRKNENNRNGEAKKQLNAHL